MSVIKTRIVRIGNSQGVRIPKLILEQTGLKDDVELEVGEGEIVIRELSHPRQDWESAFKAMAKRGDDNLLDDDGTPLTVWDEEEWEW